MRAKRVRLIGGVKERPCVALLTPSKNERSLRHSKCIQYLSGPILSFCCLNKVLILVQNYTVWEHSNLNKIPLKNINEFIRMSKNKKEWKFKDKTFSMDDFLVTTSD